MHKRPKGFTLVEVLIAMVLLCLIVLFVTQVWLKLINSSRLAETTVDASINSSTLLQQLQEVFMQGKEMQVVNDKVVILTADDPRSFEIMDNMLLLDGKALTRLISGGITTGDNCVSFDLITPSKHVIKATFYILGGQYEEAPI